MKVILVRLPHGAVIEQDGQSLVLQHGINDLSPQDTGLVEKFIARNSRLACVRDAQVCVVDDGRADPVVIRSKRRTCAA